MDKNRYRVIRLLGGLVFLIAATVITGWCLDIPILISITPNMTAMNPVTAVLFLLIGAWFFIYCIAENKKGVRAFEKIIGILVLLLGSIKLLDYAGIGSSVHIDELLFTAKLSVRMRHNAIAPTTAILFAMTGFILLNARTTKRLMQGFNDILLFAAFLVSYLGIIGYIYSLEPFYRIGPFVPMALNTAICFMLVLTALLLAMPGGGIYTTIFSKHTGGKLMSRAIPLVLLIPPAFGYTRLFLQRAKFYEMEYSVALDTASIVLAVLLLIYYYARLLNKNDAKRKIIEEQLEKSREMFSDSFKYSAIGKALIAPGGKWIEVNKVICRMTGYTMEELLQMHYNDITHPDDIGIDNELVQQLLKREIPFYSIEKRYISKERKVIVANLTVTLVWDSEYVPEFFICNIVDITNERELKDALLHNNQELQTTSENLYNKINQLEQLNHIIAHNFRGPVSNIKMLSEDQSIFPMDEAMPLINRSSLKLLGDLDDLLNLSEISLNKSISYDDCNIREIINNICLQLQGVIYQKNAEIILELEMEQLSYPKIYLESILYNLISNAIKYSRAAVKPKILVSVVTTDGKTQLSVQDNGLGIDLEQYGDKVFGLNEIFHEGFDSKGVGLFITKTQIEALGGNIAVKSKVNEGTTFTVTF